MGMQVNTNIAANNAYRNLATTQNDLSKSLEKLSSGLRINRAADDAAGLTISEGLKSQVGGLTVASRNAQDAISVIQTAEGSLNEVTSILQRMRDLAVQAGNDSNNADSRTAITTEVDALTLELTRISNSTNFNGTKLLSGDVDSVTTGNQSSLSFQVGASGDGSSRINVNLANANVKNITNNFAIVAGTAEIPFSAGSPATTGAVTVTDIKIDRTKLANHFTVTQGGTGGKTFNVDFGAADTNRTDDSIQVALQTAADALGTASQYFVVTKTAPGVFSIESQTASLNSATTNAITMSANATANTADSNAVTGGLTDGVGTSTAEVIPKGADTVFVAATQDTGLNFDSAEKAATSIRTLDAQIAVISTARAELGASQNRFESVIKNLAVSKENLTAAGSRIRDTDMAEEMVKYTRANILAQAGTAMLAQANQSNSGVLQLLQ
ncbi:flagellin [Cryobacterium flavum]|uniref:Flagellin n=1 Tax=Cryobacterium flavum TaxID=1424659 RepID=A0A4R8UYR5_9MICO|nr:flagellin [Cryobacterium flavum]TFB73041.1 flagellin [Cryobacterium flavum]SDN02411.1 flagellin [Cryobacterium flavum]